MSKYWKAGRNQPCICGSGKKFKKCCLPIERGLVEVAHLLGLKVVREERGSNLWSPDEGWIETVRVYVDHIMRGLEPDAAQDLKLAAIRFVTGSALFHVRQHEDVQEALEVTGMADSCETMLESRLRYLHAAKSVGFLGPNVFLTPHETASALLNIHGYLS